MSPVFIGHRAAALALLRMPKFSNEFIQPWEHVLVANNSAATKAFGALTKFWYW
jgi:hypothetical protein